MNTSEYLKQLKNDIAASLYIKPCDEDELATRDFLKTISRYGQGLMLQRLDNEGATYYRGDVVHIKKAWAKKNLQEYELDL